MWRLVLCLGLVSAGCGQGAPSTPTPITSTGEFANATAADAPGLVEVFRDRDNVARRQAAFRAIVSIGKPAVPTLVDGLKDEDPEVRIDCASALGEIGPAALEAVPALKNALNDDVGDVVGAVSIAFRKIDPDAARDAGVQ